MGIKELRQSLALRFTLALALCGLLLGSTSAHAAGEMETAWRDTRSQVLSPERGCHVPSGRLHLPE
jgi:hypothetical protein